VITVGVGATSGVSAEEVLAAIDAVLPAGRTDVQLSTLTKRALEPGIAGAAAARHWPLVGHDADELSAVAVQDPSSLVAEAVGTASVAEAAARLGGGRLIVGKTVLGRVTVAVAES
jgi:cobalamin biosynthesis protein CbiG